MIGLAPATLNCDVPQNGKEVTVNRVLDGIMYPG
jgi:hypothetical protein